MIPLRDNLEPGRIAFVTYGLIAACVVVWLAQPDGGSEAFVAVINEHGLIPARFVRLGERGGFLQLALYVPFLSSMFLHGDIVHLVSNGIFLWVFGERVEGRVGGLGFASLYALGGGFAAGAQVSADPTSTIPMVGASGAIAAVMGAYLLLYPTAWIRTLVLVVVVPIPSFVWLGTWFALQLLQAGARGTAWWAHAAGFAFGAAWVLVLGLRRPRAPLPVEG